MNILVYGAGVLGSLYAAWLQEAGQHVSLLARGQRLQDICEHGIVLEDVLSGQTTTTQVKVVEQLGPADRYDLAVVVMGKHEVAAILPRLAANKQIPRVLFLHNNAAGPQAMIEALGRERVLLGFAGAGGKREDHIIHSLLIKQQPPGWSRLPTPSKTPDSPSPSVRTSMPPSKPMPSLSPASSLPSLWQEATTNSHPGETCCCSW